MALGVLLVTAVFASGPLLALRTAETPLERIVLGLLGVLFAIPFGWALWRTPRVVRGMGLDIDAAGIHPFDGGRTDSIPWVEIDRVGFGAYSRRYRGIKTRTMSAFEIYRIGDDEPAQRFTVSPYGSDAERIENAVRRFRPQVWAGPFTHEC